MRYDAVPLPLIVRCRTAARTIAVLSAAAALLLGARRLDPLPNGLRGQYFANTDWAGEPAKIAADPTPSTDALYAAAGGPAHHFSASWSGWIVAPRDDIYTFATTSDDGSWVYVDNAPVVDNGTARATTTRTGPTIRLARGPHALFVRYFQIDGHEELAWLWQRGSGAFEPVPAWALRPRRIEFARFAADRGLEIVADAAPWLWAASVIVVLFVAFRPEIGEAATGARATIAELKAEGAWPALLWILAGATAMNVVALWWGLPRGTWMGDELIPVEVLSASAAHFMHGWHDKYPPLHYMLLNAAYLPVLALQAAGGMAPETVETLLFVTGRALSVVMAAGALTATFFCGRRVFGSRAGLLAAAMFAITVPFPYYAKAANVDTPYLMWFAICLVFYLRVLDGGSAADYAWWAAAGTFAVCTKDQVFGLLIAMPVIAVVEQARRHAAAGIDRPLWRAIADRRIGAATITAIVAFALCHNLLLNPSGFAGHIRMILESESYRVYPRTFAGRVTVQAVALRLIERNFGWPMFAAVVGGIVAALASRRHRRIAVYLLLTAASYHLAFINTILFAYDRFLLPVCLMLSLFGGYALDRLVASAGSAALPLRRGAVVAAFGYTFLYAGTIDALMLTDSRYGVERWMAEHVKDGDQVAMSSVATYMPRLWRFAATEVYERESFDEIRPKWYVLNPEYTVTEPSDTALGRIIADVRNPDGAYRLAYRSPDLRPLRWLPGGHPDMVGDRRSAESLSFLRNISPTIEIYERVAP